MDYVQNPEKTENGNYVSAYECDPKTVHEEFLLTKREYQHKVGRQQRNDVIAYMIRQSFKLGEITPEEANRIGYELGIRFTKGKHAFIVDVHTDKAHIHNHIIFNLINLEATKKFNNFWFSGLAIQRLSNIICLENGLSVIEKKSEKPKDFDEFLSLLEQANYQIKRGKHIALKGKGEKTIYSTTLARRWLSGRRY